MLPLRCGVLLALVLLVSCDRARDRAFGPADRPWTTADFEQLAATQGCGSLPRSGTERFERMIEPAVVATLAPADGSDPQRIPAVLAFVDAVRPIFQRYSDCRDLVGVLGVNTMMIEATGQMLPLMATFVARFPSDDPSYQARVAGLEQVRAGLVAMARGAALIVTDNEFRAPVPRLGLRLGAALARARTLLPAGALDGAIAGLAADPALDPNPHRRALRADIVAGLGAADGR